MRISSLSTNAESLVQFMAKEVLNSIIHHSESSHQPQYDLESYVLVYAIMRKERTRLKAVAKASPKGPASIFAKEACSKVVDVLNSQFGARTFRNISQARSSLLDGDDWESFKTDTKGTERTPLLEAMTELLNIVRDQNPGIDRRNLYSGRTKRNKTVAVQQVYMDGEDMLATLEFAIQDEQRRQNAANEVQSDASQDSGADDEE